MLQIKKMRSDHVIDFAAEELKKYLRMMMPQCGDIGICYDPNATDGFRLGLLEDFGLPCEAEDPVLDDVIHVDTLFAAETVKVKNPNRFSLLYAPIFRSYSSSITEDAVIPEPAPYVRNNWQMPKAPEEALAFLKSWQKVFPGPCFSYEYHYWRNQFSDPGLMTISRRIYEDIRSLKYCGLDGYVEDYFSHIYGDSWKAVRSYLTRVSEAFDFSYLNGEKSENKARGDHYSPEAAKRLEKVRGLAAEGRAIAKDHRVMPDRPKTVSMRLLELHAEYIGGVAAFMIEKAKGNDHLAYEMFTEFFLEYGRHEFEIERYYDHGLAWLSYSLIVRKPPENYMGN